MGKIIGGIAGILAFLAIIGGIIYGYVNNILSLVTNQAESLGMILGRVIGIFVAPLGVVLGYF